MKSLGEISIDDLTPEQNERIDEFIYSVDLDLLSKSFVFYDLDLLVYAGELPTIDILELELVDHLRFMLYNNLTDFVAPFWTIYDAPKFISYYDWFCIRAKFKSMLDSDQIPELENNLKIESDTEISEEDQPLTDPDIINIQFAHRKYIGERTWLQLYFTPANFYEWDIFDMQSESEKKPEDKLLDKIAYLNLQLSEAIEKEDYETASKIKAEITKLNKKK